MAKPSGLLSLRNLCRGLLGGGGGGHGAAVARVVVPWGSGSGRSGAPGGCGGALGNGSGASWWLRRGGGVGSVGDGGGCAVRGGSKSAGVCGTRPRPSSWGSHEVSAGLEGASRGAAW